MIPVKASKYFKQYRNLVLGLPKDKFRNLQAGKTERIEFRLYEKHTRAFLISNKVEDITKFKNLHDQLHFAPEEYFFEDDNYIVQCINLFKWEFIVKSDRIDSVEDDKIIEQWLSNQSILEYKKDYWNEQILKGLIRTLKIPVKDRILLYKIFKTKVMKNLSNAIKIYKKLIPSLKDTYLKSREINILKLMEYLENRKIDYEIILDIFPAAGENVFSYRNLKQLYLLLEKHGLTKSQQIMATNSLFQAYNFELNKKDGTPLVIEKERLNTFWQLRTRVFNFGKKFDKKINQIN